ncbi:hypothetical protein Tco_0774899 [Tanacetum coccineum]|uniref:Uncharacterized protein n=1 Tax=Tanacetum coccineum TaxID=301880 RepID=A0ABQ4ZPT3_9ASTR
MNSIQGLRASSVKVPVENVTLSSSAHLLRENIDSFPVFATGVPVGPVFLLGLLALAIDAACAFRAEEMPSLISCWMAAKVMAGVSDVDVLLGGILSTEDNTYFSGTKKYRGSNSNDSGNTGDEVKIVGEVIGSGGEIGFSEELKEMLPDEAGK